jgi:hypothetical protein
VHADGTFDATRSKNVVSSAQGFNVGTGMFVPGIYCLELSVVPSNVVVSMPRVGGDPGGQTAYALIPAVDAGASSLCPAPTANSVQVHIANSVGNPTGHPFYLVVN